MFRSRTTPAFLLALACMVLLSACTTIDLYEKTEAIPGHQWRSDFRPSFQFNITDTAAPYQLYIIFRHNDQYNFNNIWINLYRQGPGDSTRKVQYELPLASKDKGWLGSAMDDIYEHRIALTAENQYLRFPRKGVYTFTIEQIMRQDPLLHAMNIGLRVEKKQLQK